MLQYIYLVSLTLKTQLFKPIQHVLSVYTVVCWLYVELEILRVKYHAASCKLQNTHEE